MQMHSGGQCIWLRFIWRASIVRSHHVVVTQNCVFQKAAGEWFTGPKCCIWRENEFRPVDEVILSDNSRIDAISRVKKRFRLKANCFLLILELRWVWKHIFYFIWLYIKMSSSHLHLKWIVDVIFRLCFFHSRRFDPMMHIQIRMN